MKYKTIMWREYPMIVGDLSYRINTTDPAVAKRLRIAVGDVCKITRVTLSAGETEYYRVCK